MVEMKKNRTLLAPIICLELKPSHDFVLSGEKKDVLVCGGAKQIVAPVIKKDQQRNISRRVGS